MGLLWIQISHADSNCPTKKVSFSYVSVLSGSHDYFSTDKCYYFHCIVVFGGFIVAVGIVVAGVAAVGWRLSVVIR